MRPGPSCCRQLARATRPSRLVCSRAVLASASKPQQKQQSSSYLTPGEGRTLRRLILLRHAESDQSAGVRDHDRQISDLGRRQAAEVAALLKSRGWTPDLVLASNSRRTRQTLEEMGWVMGELGGVDAHFYGSLYTVAALDGQTRDHIAECLLEVVDDGRNACVMCVGHNKGWEEAASQLAGSAVKLRTASAALLQCYAASWREVLTEGVRWQLVEVVAPAYG